MANYSETFDSAGTGSGLPSGWSARWANTTSWERVDTGSGDIAVRRNTSSAARSGASYDAVDSDSTRADADILVKIRTASVASFQTHCGVFARASGSAGAETAYAAFIYGPALRIIKYNGGTATTISTTSSLGLVADTWYWLRLRVNGTTQQARIWLDGDSEPGTWDATGTDSAITAAGWCGFFAFYASSTNQDWADFAVATNGDTAEMSAGGGVTGTLSATLDGAASSAGGSLAIAGAAAATLAGATSSATGALQIQATAAATLTGATLSAAGALVAEGSGTLAATLDGATAAATGTLAIAGTAAATLAGATLAAESALTAPGTGAVFATLAGVSVSAAGHVDIAAALGVTLGDLVLSAEAALALSGAAAATLAGASLAAAGGATAEEEPQAPSASPIGRRLSTTQRQAAISTTRRRPNISTRTR